jgi:hypothetical protein
VFVEVKARRAARRPARGRGGCPEARAPGEARARLPRRAAARPAVLPLRCDRGVAGRGGQGHRRATRSARLRRGRLAVLSRGGVRNPSDAARAAAGCRFRRAWPRGARARTRPAWPPGDDLRSAWTLERIRSVPTPTSSNRHRRDEGCVTPRPANGDARACDLHPGRGVGSPDRATASRVGSGARSRRGP